MWFRSRLTPSSSWEGVAPSDVPDSVYARWNLRMRCGIATRFVPIGAKKWFYKFIEVM
jgi:hypothetical protein